MNFTVYSRPGCVYCTKIEQVLKLTEQKYIIYKLGKDFSPEQFTNEFGEGATFPQVTCNGKTIGGCSDAIAFLKEEKLI